MPVDIRGSLRRALTQLQVERTRIDQKISALQAALTAVGGGGSAPARGRPARRRRRMSAAARKAISQRMRAYWAQRRRSAKGG